MRILIIGGTRFVGRHLVAAAIARGHEVTVMHRGVECSGAPGAEHLHADRDADLGVLSGRRVGRHGGRVRLLARARSRPWPMRWGSAAVGTR